MNIKTPISWIGNKTSILPIIYAVFPLRYKKYVEPFGGSGAVLLGKKRPDKFEVYNDYNSNGDYKRVIMDAHKILMVNCKMKLDT